MSSEPKLLPAWAARLKEGYLSGEASQFLLHSNVGDLVPWEDDGGLEYVSLTEFLTRFLSRTKEIVAFYNVSEGLVFAKKEMHEKFIEQMKTARRQKGDGEWSGVIPSSPSRLLGLLGQFLTVPSHRAAVVIEYLETMVPDGDMAYLSSEDRACLVAVQEWSREPGLLASDNVVVMVADSVMEVNRRVRSQPQVMSIEVGLPDRGERLRFIGFISGRYRTKGLPPEQLADMTAGLSRLQIESIFKHAADSKEPISMELVSKKRKEVIERECQGLVEVIDPRFGFESVGGLDEIKRSLLAVSDAIRSGETRRAPMGIMLVGPMGTGKSFLAEAFAKESGLTCLKLKSFREKWVGSTEANLERILGIIEALGYVLVIIDEADRNMGSESRDNDSGTESRVMARLKEFMSDAGHRGRIVFMVLTNRPDRLDTDLKRPGRLDFKVPMFYPEAAAERAEIMRAIVNKNRLVLNKVDLGRAAERLSGYSAADLEGLLVTADRLAAEDKSASIKPAHLEAALTDFVPSRDRLYIEYMEILAVFEASSRRLLPARYRDVTEQELFERLRLVRARLGL